MDTEQYLTKSTINSTNFFNLKRKVDENHSTLLISNQPSNDLNSYIIPVEEYESTCLDAISDTDLNQNTVESGMDSPTVYFMDSSMERLKHSSNPLEMELIVEDTESSDMKNILSEDYKEDDHSNSKDSRPICSVIIEGNRPYKMKSSSRNSTSVDPVSGSWVTLRRRKEILKSKGHTWKSGSWSREEIQLLQQNINQYCQDHNISDPTEIIFRNSKEDRRSRKDFYPSITSGLNRPLFAVYRKVKRMYDVKNYKGKYSEEELQKLNELLQIHGRDWGVIAQQLGRSSDSVKDRCRLLKSDSIPISKGKWNEEEEENLAEAVYKTMKKPRGVSITEGIPWCTIAKIVKTRTEKQCRAKWLNYLNWKIVKGSKWTKDDDKKLVERSSSSF